MQSAPLISPVLRREVEASWQEAKTLGRRGVVGCLVCRDDGRCFVQKRSLSRRLFPGCWDLVGGHLEGDETPWQALEREIDEETGWQLASVKGLLRVVDWESPGPNGQQELKREWVFSVTIAGNEDSPHLEKEKVTEGRWIGRDEVSLLSENRSGGDDYVERLAQLFFESETTSRGST